MRSAPLARSRPRPRSVAGDAEQRHILAWWLLGGAPVLLFMAGLLAISSSPELALLLVVECATLFLALTAWDMAEWARARRAARRMKRGAPPARPGIDYGIGDDCWLRTAPAEDPYRAQPRVELLARGSPAAAARLIGRNLLVRAGGVLVLTLGPLLAMLGVCNSHSSHGVSTTRTALNTVRSAVVLFQVGHREVACPTVSQLVDAGTLDRGFRGRDAWDRPLKITCDDDDVTVRSVGPDGKEGTPDDIVVPVPVDASVP